MKDGGRPPSRLPSQQCVRDVCAVIVSQKKGEQAEEDNYFGGKIMGNIELSSFGNPRAAWLSGRE